MGGFPSTAVCCKHDHIYRKRQSGNLHVVGNRSKLASLLLGLGLGGTFWEEVGAAVRELDLWSVECLVGDELAVSTQFTVCRKLHSAVQIIILHHVR